MSLIHISNLLSSLQQLSQYILDALAKPKSSMLLVPFPDPSHVVGLFPNLLPGDYRSQLEYPDRIPDLDGTELERGLTCLIDYLTQVVHC